MENTSKNFFETMTEMQKKLVENFNDVTEKAKKNIFSTNYMDSDPFKKWYDSQMSFFNQSHDKKGENDPMNFFNTWMENQMNFGKTWLEQTQNTFTKMSKDATATPNMDMYNSWMETMNKSYGEMIKNFSGKNEGMNSFSGLFNNSQNYMKMFEIWMPMLGSLKDKSFTPESFKSMFNAQLFKNYMDSVFNMQPDYMKDMMNKYNDSMKSGFESFSTQGKSYYDTLTQNMRKSMPNGLEAFDQFSNMYKSYSDSLNQAFSPIMKMITPGTQKDQINTLNELSNDFSQYNMLNNKMQYMMYSTGVKAMEEVSETIFNKMKNGEDMSNFLNIYQEYLNINDKNFVKLFDSEEYSKLQGEFNAIDMKIKRAVNLQMEKSLAHLPLINRTEMDELYKTVYELKKQISELVKFNKASVVNMVATATKTAESATAATESKTESSKATAKPAAKKA